MSMRRPVRDLRGVRFGRLVAKELVGLSPTEWLCACDCGQWHRSKGFNLLSGGVRSCGCAAGRAPVMIGRKIGRWTIEKQLRRDQHGFDRWLCACDCGTRRNVNGSSLRIGGSSGCGGCDRSIEDLTGQRFGGWIVLGLESCGEKGALWIRMCDCGTVDAQRPSNIKKSRSCGCVTPKPSFGESHGGPAGRQTTEYRAWAAMNQRCSNPKHDAWRYYGGRGIRVCRGWRRSFRKFLADMGRKPTRDHSIDRKNNNGDYTPRNCRWATRSEQCKNRRTAERIAIDAIKMEVADADSPLTFGFSK